MCECANTWHASVGVCKMLTYKCAKAEGWFFCGTHATEMENWGNYEFDLFLLQIDKNMKRLYSDLNDLHMYAEKCSLSKKYKKIITWRSVPTSQEVLVALATNWRGQRPVAWLAQFAHFGRLTWPRTPHSTKAYFGGYQNLPEFVAPFLISWR